MKQKNIILIFIFLVFVFNLTFAQELTLKDLRITPFYTEKETQTNFISELGQIQVYLNEDVNSDFSNFSDLDFLRKIPNDNKMVMIGEAHYSKSISYLRNRIFFALNSFDYYPLIIIEYPYSTTEFYNYYVHLKNDNEAKDFLDNELSDFIYTEEDLSFLENLRRWNKNNSKELNIGGNDLEFGYNVIIDKILRPYFHKLKNVEKTTIDTIIDIGINQGNDFFVRIKPYLHQAKQENLIGKYPFITPQYIENVITNFSSTNNAFRYSFDYYRQQAIIRNISDDKFYGKFLKNHKIVTYGGSTHMKNHFVFPNNANFLSEGSYFNHNFDVTKNKTYSINIDCFSYSYGEMVNRKLSDCLRQGNQYSKMIKIFQKGFENNLIKKEQPYFFYEGKNRILRFISQFYYQNKLISFSKKQWDKITNSYSKSDNNEKLFIDSKKENFTHYDKYIIVPASEIVTARLKR